MLSIGNLMVVMVFGTICSIQAGQDAWVIWKTSRYKGAWFFIVSLGLKDSEFLFNGKVVLWYVLEFQGFKQSSACFQEIPEQKNISENTVKKFL